MNSNKNEAQTLLNLCEKSGKNIENIYVKKEWRYPNQKVTWDKTHTLLDIALMNGKIDIVSAILKKLSTNCKNKRRKYSYINGNKKLPTWLIAINMYNLTGIEEYKSILNILLLHGANVDLKRSKDPWVKEMISITKKTFY